MWSVPPIENRVCVCVCSATLYFLLRQFECVPETVANGEKPYTRIGAKQCNKNECTSFGDSRSLAEQKLNVEIKHCATISNALDSRISISCTFVAAICRTFLELTTFFSLCVQSFTKASLQQKQIVKLPLLWEIGIFCCWYITSS